MLWAELTGLISWWNSPCCIGGDFNIIHFLSERSSGARLSLAILEFFKFFFEQGLIYAQEKRHILFQGHKEYFSSVLWIQLFENDIRIN